MFTGKIWMNSKNKRNAVNEFMKRAAETTVRNIEAIAKSDKLSPAERQKILPRMEGVMGELAKRASRIRYFDSGVKLEDLVDFKVWLNEADRLGIKLDPNHVKSLLNTEMLVQIMREYPVFDAFNREFITTIVREMRATSQRTAMDALVFKGLNDEFRVRLAQLVLAMSDPYLDPEGIAGPRFALSPAMLWDSFKANRTAFNVAIVPFDVEKFTAQVSEPTEADLKSMFQSHFKDRYDPASPKPGFEILPSARVEIVVGDPASPKFKQWSRVALLMEATPPVWIPSSPWTMLERYVGGPLEMRKALEDQYNFVKEPQNPIREDYLTARLDEPDVYFAMAGYLARKHAEAAASWIAAYAQPSNFATAQLGYYAVGAARHPEELRKGLAEESKVRVPLYAPFILQGTSSSYLENLGMLALPNLNKEKFFPLDFSAEPLTEILENHQAQTWVNKNMNALRKKLDDANVVGKKAQFERELSRSLEPLGLERRTTKDKVFYNRFTIEKAQELQPLLQAFNKKYIDYVNTIEGRNLEPEKMLKEGDFYKLFFDPTETFSATGSTYRAKPWPPMVTPKNGLGKKRPARRAGRRGPFRSSRKTHLVLENGGQTRQGPRIHRPGERSRGRGLESGQGPRNHGPAQGQGIGR